MLGNQGLYKKAFDTCTLCWRTRIVTLLDPAAFGVASAWLAMDRGGASMDAGQDVWDWEVLQPDQMSSSNLADDQETKEHIIMPPSSGVDAPEDECKDIGVVLDETVPKNREEAMPGLTQAPTSDAEEKTFQSTDGKKVHDEKFDEEGATEGEAEEKTIQSPDAKKDHDKKFDAEEATEETAFQSSDTRKDHDEKFDQQEDEDAIKKENGGARLDCVVFSVGKLKVNGIGALCSFGVAAATFCIFLIGGKLQHHHRQQQHKIQLQFYGDDKRIQQVVQETSRLNQAMSSVMGGGASTRANISFGGFYDGL